MNAVTPVIERLRVLLINPNEPHPTSFKTSFEPLVFADCPSYNSFPEKCYDTLPQAIELDFLSDLGMKTRRFTDYYHCYCAGL